MEKLRGQPDVSELEPTTRKISTYVLQEYFIPVTSFKKYAGDLLKLMQSIDTNTLNISIRHCKADPYSLMSWAREDVFCFVVYYKQRMQTETERFVGEWTRAMISLAIQHGGAYYLHYQLHATPKQFNQAYPNSENFRKLRKEMVSHRFCNAMWEKYHV